MDTLELKNGLFWTGIQDRELKVFDIIMETEFGTTYNSYLLKGSEKTVLFETAKAKFLDEYLTKLRSLTDLSSINYIIVNHTEPDHAGSVEMLLDENPDIQIVGSAAALGFLRQIVNRDFNSIAVKDNDTLSLGDKTLRFLQAPNLHWPDTMYTYVEEDNVLVTCDSFGSHYNFDHILLSRVTDEEGYMRALKYYFDNILGPFKPFMLKALDKVDKLDVDMICTGHGPVLDCRIDEIKKIYREWCQVINPNTKKTVVIPYVSAYGYTEQIGREIKKGIQSAGDIEVKLFDMVEADKEEVLREIRFADGVIFGSPTILGEALPPIWELTVNLYPAECSGKAATAFGSYGWSGEAVPHLLERLKQLKMKVSEGLKVKFKPGKEDLLEAFSFGENFGKNLVL